VGLLWIMHGTLLMNQKAKILEDYCGYELNSVAWDFYEKVTDLMAIKKALCWSKRSLEISPEKHEYWDTYAHLLYKLGRKNKAILAQKKAIKFMKKFEKDDEMRDYYKTLEKMKLKRKDNL
jgi:tetratricopeptide (TPR) repeat protein